MDYELVLPDGALQGGELLPGLQISLRELFAEVDRTGPLRVKQ